jgi:hypothetical protein
MFSRIFVLLFSLCFCAHGNDLNELLGKPSPDRYEMADGSTLIISREAGHDTIKTGEGKTIAELAPNEIVAQAVQSPNKNFLLFLLRTHSGRIDRRGTSTILTFDFFGVARLAPNSPGWLFHRVWTPADASEFDVRELGAVSNDGVRALLKIGRKSAAEAPYRIDDYWETWDLDQKVMIRRGLTVE